MIRFAAFAVLAANCIILISSGPTGENKIDPFEVYNAHFEQCREIPLEQLRREVAEDDVPSIEEIKSNCPVLQDYEGELELETKCLHWIRRKNVGDLNVLVIALYMQRLAMHFDDIILGNLGQMSFSDSSNERIPSEREEMKKTLSLVGNLILLLAMYDPYKKTASAIMTARKTSAGENLNKQLYEIELDNYNFMKIIGDDEKQDDIFSDIYYGQAKEPQEARQESREFGKYIHYRRWVQRMRQDLHDEEKEGTSKTFQKFLPGSTFLARKQIFRSRNDFVKLQSNIKRSNLLNPRARIKGSRVAGLIKVSLFSFYGEKGPSTSTEATTSTMNP